MKTKMNLVVFSGAGLDAESGISTFRDSNGLWENYSIEEVATAEAIKHNLPKVLEFYNLRRKDALKAEPNQAHHNLKLLEEKFNVTHITQNISNLLERAGCSNILHLHGNITEASFVDDPSKSIPWDGDIYVGSHYGNKQLRPNVVLFGEMIHNVEESIEVLSNSDIVVVIGTSLNVFPAAGLLNYAPHENFFIIDPKPPNIQYDMDPIHYKVGAIEGTEKLLELFGIEREQK